MALNNVVIVGRLTKDVELKQAGESTVANFTLAVDKPYNKDKEHPEANWIDCVAWNKTAEFISKYFTKGKKIGVTGSLQTRTYEDKDTKKKIKVTEVMVSTADFIESKGDDQTNTTDNSSKTSDSTKSSASEVIATPTDDDIPF